MISARCLHREMAGSFHRSLPTTPHFEICQMKQGNFSLLFTTGKNLKCQTPGQKKSPLTYYYNRQGTKWPGAEPGNKKSSKSVSDILLHVPLMGEEYSTFVNIIKLMGWIIGVCSEIAQYYENNIFIYLRAHAFYDRISKKNGGIDYEYTVKMAFRGRPLFKIVSG